MHIECRGKHVKIPVMEILQSLHDVSLSLETPGQPQVNQLQEVSPGKSDGGRQIKRLPSVLTGSGHNGGLESPVFPVLPSRSLPASPASAGVTRPTASTAGNARTCVLRCSLQPRQATPSPTRAGRSRTNRAVSDLLLARFR